MLFKQHQQMANRWVFPLVTQENDGDGDQNVETIGNLYIYTGFHSLSFVIAFFLIQK